MQFSGWVHSQLPLPHMYQPQLVSPQPAYVTWTHEPDGSRRFCIDGYLDERANWIAWRGIRVRNWHRPLSTYMSALLDAGFELRHFDEPAPQGIDDDKARRYRRAPNFLIMEWQKVGHFRYSHFAFA